MSFPPEYTNKKKGFKRWKGLKFHKYTSKMNSDEYLVFSYSFMINCLISTLFLYAFIKNKQQAQEHCSKRYLNNPRNMNALQPLTEHEA